MKALVILSLGLVLMILGALFTGANDTLVTFDYLLGDFQWPVSYLLLAAFVAGMVLTLLLMLPIYIKSKAVRRRFRKKLLETQKELENLRTLPIQK